MIATYHYEFRNGKWKVIGKWVFVSECGCAHYINLDKHNPIKSEKFYRMRAFNSPIQSSFATSYGQVPYSNISDTTIGP